jgi:ABC-type multidrug transport system fused ATPase/permease subunit
MNETDVWREDQRWDARSISSTKGDIEFDAVNFTYPSRKDVSVLRNLSLTARAGQTTALVGSSGCGQSLLK